LIVADLAPPTLERRLRQEGLCLRLGPLVVKIRSTLQAVREGIALHYAGQAVEPSEGFADFHVSVGLPRHLRRWLNHEVVFRLDGTEPMAPMPGTQGFAMLERGLSWCVSSHCDQYLMLRAAVLERSGRALILPGASRSGKSTLCAGLVFGGGWRLLSDDLALIEPASGAVVPLPRPLSLANDSIDVVRQFAPAAVFGCVELVPVKGRAAHVRPPDESVLRANERALPAWVVVPRYVPDIGARLEPLSRARAFMALVDHAFNYNLHGRNGFSTLAALIDRSECHAFNYSSLGEAVAVFDRLGRSAP
jgi:HprK-related kinase A